MGRRIFSWLFFFLANALYHTLCSINGCLSGRGEALESVRNNNFFYKRKKKTSFSSCTHLERLGKKCIFIFVSLFFSPNPQDQRRSRAQNDTFGQVKEQMVFFFFYMHKMGLLATDIHIIGIPTNIGITRAAPTAAPLVVISEGVEIGLHLRCSKGPFYHYFNTLSGVRTSPPPPSLNAH